MKVLQLAIGTIGVLGLADAMAATTITTNETVVTISAGGGVSATVTETFAEPQVTRVVLKDGNVDLNPVGVSSFSQGLSLVDSKAQLRLTTDRGLGTGAIELNGGSALLTQTVPVDVNNRVLFSDDAFAGSVSTGRLTLRELGFLPSSTQKRVTLGRAGANATSPITLTLNENSDPIGYFALRGAAAVTVDGGTVRGSAEDGSELFRLGNAQATPTVNVAFDGFNYQGAEGTSVSIGETVPVLFPDCGPGDAELANGDFEAGTGGWLFGKVENSNTIPGNLSAPDGTWNTRAPNGTKVMCLRWGQSLESVRGFDVAIADEYVITADLAPRNTNGNVYDSAKIKVEALVDGESYPLVGVYDYEKYVTFSTERIRLTPGVHSLKFHTIQNGAGSNAAMLFDNVRVKMTSSRGSGALVKNGPGALWIGSLAKVEKLTVNEGVVAIRPSGFAPNAAIRVKSGAKLKLMASRDSLVKDGSFEHDATQNDLKSQELTYWSRVREDSTLQNAGNVGLQGNGGNVSKTAPHTTVGTHTLYLRQGFSVTQDIPIVEAGKYRFSMLTACRSGYSSDELRLKVTIGDTTVCSDVAPGSASKFIRHTFEVDLQAGNQILKITTTSTPDVNGAMVFIDDVQLMPIYDEADKVITGTVIFEKGSCLYLDKGVDIHFEKVMLGDEELRFNHASQAKDVFVDGEGDASAGRPLGLTIYLR